MTTREEMIEAAKAWLEANTGFRWAVEPDPLCPDVPVSTLNRRMRMRAKMLADFALEQIEAAIAADRSRIVAALEAERQSAEYGGTTYREITQNAFDVAIAIVKGGDER